MVSEVGVRELKNKLSEHLRKVKAGEDLIITEHGKPVAKLVRLPERPAWLQGMIDRGEATGARGGPIRGARIKLRGKGPLASDYVIQQRG